ncbi:MAG TPA: methyltransferase [Gaiellaceae bacterium]|nr:methyltransferase [Gaiellaceae bacterium]
MTAEGPLRLDDRGLIAELRDVLQAAGFDGAGVQEALGTSSELLTGSYEIPIRERRLEGREPVGTLIKLFVLEQEVPADAAKKALAPLSLEQLTGLGLLEESGGKVQRQVRLVPHDEIVIASDRRIGPGADRPDHVAGVHNPSLTLSHLTVRRPVESALDMGAGSGVQSILASRHSERVVATDLNERALNFAAFNALLNDAENVEVRAGSFYEPVAGERFELIATNPPYVISPESAYLFRDSGLEGDSVSREVVRATPEHMAEGAFATVLVSWAQRIGDDWTEPLRPWLEGSGCDAWLLHHGTHDPLTHAANWNKESYVTGPDDLGETIDRWVAYLERLGIEGVAYGAIILRRRSGGANWIAANELPVTRLRPTSDHILRVFEAQDYLAGLADERELLEGTFALAPHDLLEQRVEFQNRGWVVTEAAAVLQDGLGLRAGLDPVTLELLTGLDGMRKLKRVVEEQARARQIDRGVLEGDAIGLVRGMLGAGFLSRKT